MLGMLESFDSGLPTTNSNSNGVQENSSKSNYLSEIFYFKSIDGSGIGSKRPKSLNSEVYLTANEIILCDECGIHVPPCKRQKKMENMFEMPQMVPIQTEEIDSEQQDFDDSVVRSYLVNNDMKILSQYFTFVTLYPSTDGDIQIVQCTLLSTNSQILIYIPSSYPLLSAEYSFPYDYDVLPAKKIVKQKFEQLILQQNEPFSLIQLLRVFICSFELDVKLEPPF